MVTASRVIKYVRILDPEAARYLEGRIVARYRGDPRPFCAEPRETPVAWLSSCMTWSAPHTPQGHDYWADLTRRIPEIERLYADAETVYNLRIDNLFMQGGSDVY